MKSLKTLLLIAASLVALPVSAAILPAVFPAPDDAAVVKEQLPSYPLKVCAVSGEKLGSMGDPVDVVHEGRLVRLCCKGCTKGVAADAEKIFEKIDQAVIAQQKAHYPMEACPVSGRAFTLEEKGEDHVVGTRLVRTCCGRCAKAVQKDPAKYLAIVNEVYIETQRKSYPIKECLVSGEELGSMGEPIDRLYGTTLVRLCCKGCVKAFEKDPDKIVAQVHKAWAHKAPAKIKDAQKGGLQKKQ